MIEKRQVEDLTLALLYATSWTEKETGDHRRSWKGYPFETLDALSDAGLVSGSKGAKSVYVTPAGQARAREILVRLGIAVQELRSATGGRRS